MAKICVKMLVDIAEKARGLLGTTLSSQEAAPVALMGCRSIHTFGMRYPIDVAFVDRAGVVCRSVRSLKAGCFASAWAASYVLERPASKDVWPECGQKVAFEKLDEKERRLAYVTF